MFYAYFLPQFEGIDDAGARRLFRVMADMLEPAEAVEVKRTMIDVLGVELAN